MIAALVAAAVLWRRARSALGFGLLRVAGILTLCTTLAFGLVFLTDAYYQSLLGRPPSAAKPSTRVAGTPIFSLQKGVQVVAAADPFDFQAMTLDSELGTLGHFNGWASKAPQWLFPRVAVGLSLLTCVCWARNWRRGKHHAAWAMGAIVAVCLVLWLVLVYP